MREDHGHFTVEIEEFILYLLVGSVEPAVELDSFSSELVGFFHVTVSDCNSIIAVECVDLFCHRLRCLYDFVSLCREVFVCDSVFIDSIFECFESRAEVHRSCSEIVKCVYDPAVKRVHPEPCVLVEFNDFVAVGICVICSVIEECFFAFCSGN